MSGFESQIRGVERRRTVRKEEEVHELITIIAKATRNETGERTVILHPFESLLVLCKSYCNNFHRIQLEMNS